jgi:hypothetical protein
MRRRYRILTFRKSGRAYVSLIVEYQEGSGAWHSRVVKSYGNSSPEVLTQAQNDLEELERLASSEEDPVPVGTVDEVIWASFYQTLKNPLLALPLLPLGIARDFSHLAAAVISSASGDLTAQINVTQPGMAPWERQKFYDWLAGQPPDNQRASLAYQWRYTP